VCRERERERGKFGQRGRNSKGIKLRRRKRREKSARTP